MHVEPVEIEIRRDHPFKKKKKWHDEARGKMVQPSGCAVCSRAKTWVGHLGATPSVNDFLSKNVQVYRGFKAAFEDALRDALEASHLPTGLARVVVEGVMCFDPIVTHKTPDQGNHRFLIEKALGDALEAGGWLPARDEQGRLAGDNWERYEFGGLAYVSREGESWTRLMLFPTATETAAAA